MTLDELTLERGTRSDKPSSQISSSGNERISMQNIANVSKDAEKQTSEGLVVLEINPNHENTTLPSINQYLNDKELALLSAAFMIATFMIALDGSILATAIPTITNDFHRLDEVGWYGSAYLLTEMSFQPLFGRIYTFFDAKITYLISIIIFEIGSIICASAPNSHSLIIGRAVSGIGAAGLLCGSLAIFGRSVPLKKRPRGLALVTSMYGIAGVIGPTLGGVITDEPRLTWRFCFWMNLPGGAATLVIAWFVMKTKPPLYQNLPLKEKLFRLDATGGILLTGALVVLFIALQWGGIMYSWSNPQVYGCLIVSGILTFIFVGWQAWKKEEATIPLRILSQRTVAISCIFNFLIAIAQMTHSYYLPFYFQAVREFNAAESGVRILAYGMSTSVAVLITGFGISGKGYYLPFMWVGGCLFLTGSVLLQRLQPTSTKGTWLGYQILTGFGLGLCEQIPFIAVQVVLGDEDMPTACALVIFSRCLGGAVGLSLAENLFLGKVRSQIPDVGVERMGIGDIGVLEEEGERWVRGVFMNGVARAFWLPVVVVSVGVVVSWGMERRRIGDEGGR